MEDDDDANYKEIDTEAQARAILQEVDDVLDGAIELHSLLGELKSRTRIVAERLPPDADGYEVDDWNQMRSCVAHAEARLREFQAHVEWIREVARDHAPSHQTTQQQNIQQHLDDTTNRMEEAQVATVTHTEAMKQRARKKN